MPNQSKKIATILENVKFYGFREAPQLWDALLNFQDQENYARGNFLEIGVAHGATAMIMGLHQDATHEALYLVDYPGTYQKTILQNFEKLVSPDLSKIHFFAKESHRFWNDITPNLYGSFRWLHIDGEHTAEAVVNDLQIAEKLIARNGVIVVDDFYNVRYPQLTEAIYDYLSSSQNTLKLFLCGFNKGYICRPSALSHYLKYCHERLIPDLEELNVKATLFKTTRNSEGNYFGIKERGNGPSIVGPDWDTGQISIYEP